MGIFDVFFKKPSYPVYDVDGHRYSSVEEYVTSEEYRDTKIPSAMAKLQELKTAQKFVVPLRTLLWWDDFFSGIEEVESMFLKGTATTEQDGFRNESIKKTSEIIEIISEYSSSDAYVESMATFTETLHSHPHVNIQGSGPERIDPIVLYIAKQFLRFFLLDEYIGTVHTENGGYVDSVNVSVHSQKLGIKKVSDLFWDKTKSFPKSNLPKYLDSFVNKHPNLLKISKDWRSGYNNIQLHFRNQQFFLDFMKLYDLIISESIMMSIPMFVRLLVSRYFDEEWKELEDNILHENPKKIEDFIKAFMMCYYNSWEERLDDFKTVLKQSKMPIEGVELMIQDFQRNIKRESFKESLLSDDSSTKISDLDVLDGIAFENFLRHLFEKMGYQCVVTKGSGDQGADLLIRRMGKLTVVQAKRYNEKVSNSAIQESAAAVKHYKADNAMVVTTNYFTKGAASLADSNNVKLIDRNKLEEWLKQYQI